MQVSSDKVLQPMVVSSYFLAAVLGQTLGPFLMNILANTFNVVAFPKKYGPLITLLTMLGFTAACPFYYWAGRKYQKIVQARNEKEAANLATVAA